MHKSLSSSHDPVIDVAHVAKTYVNGDVSTPVLTDVNFFVARGETLAIVGASGSGKSTLLHLMGGLDKPSGGTVHVAGQNVAQLSERAKGRLRNKELGFIYQFHHLLAEFTALENVCLPLLIRGTRVAEARRDAMILLDRVGLSHRFNHKPAALSGGERQRCAVARALVTRPACVLGDEPTGNLDEANAEQVYALMLEMNQEMGTSFVLVTHDKKLAARLERTVVLHQGVCGIGNNG